LTVLSSGEVAPFTLAVTTHHVQADTDATCTAPHEYFSQIGTPSTVCAKAFVKTLSLEANPTSSFGFGIISHVHFYLLLKSLQAFQVAASARPG
jgi:hypothetical protein